MSDLEETLKERRKKYGSFAVYANYVCQFQKVADYDTTELNDVQKAAMDMIFVKIARILSGDPNYIDSWHDLAGYARLVEIELQKDELREG